MLHLNFLSFEKKPLKILLESGIRGESAIFFGRILVRIRSKNLTSLSSLESGMVHY